MSGVRMAMSSGTAKPLTVTISGNQGAGGTSASHVFSASVTVANGSGSYTYAWQFDSLSGSGNWTFGSQGAASTSVNLTFVLSGDTSQALASCVVTDTVTGKTVTSSDAAFTYTRS